MLTARDLEEVVTTVAAMRDAVGEPVTWRRQVGEGVYEETTIRALLTPVAPGLVSAGFYLLTDLQLVTGVEVLPGDQIVRFGQVFDVLDQPFARRVSDRVFSYETKVRKV